MIKLAVFDIDKTLLDDKSRLPEDFDEYISLLKAEGVETGVASARPFFSIEELFGDRIKDLVGSCDNGNTIFRGHDYIVQNCWKPEDIRYLVSIVGEDPDVGIVFSGTDHYYADPLTVKMCISHGREYMISRMTDIEEAIAEGVEICNCHYVCFYEKYPSIRECVQEKLGGVLKEPQRRFSLNDAGWGWVAVTRQDGGKAAGLRSLMQAEHAAPDETCVFGDSDNDIPMFREAKFSYAMKNAAPSVLEAASYITDEDNNHNGAMKAALSRAREEKLHN